MSDALDINRYMDHEPANNAMTLGLLGVILIIPGLGGMIHHAGVLILCMFHPVVFLCAKVYYVIPTNTMDRNKRHRVPTQCFPVVFGCERGMLRMISLTFLFGH